MGVYKVIFAKEEVVACFETMRGVPGGGTGHLEHNSHGSPIYALVEAGDSLEACSIARKMASQSANSHPRHIGDPSSDPD